VHVMCTETISVCGMCISTIHTRQYTHSTIRTCISLCIERIHTLDNTHTRQYTLAYPFVSKQYTLAYRNSTHLHIPPTNCVSIHPTHSTFHTETPFCVSIHIPHRNTSHTETMSRYTSHTQNTLHTETRFYVSIHIPRKNGHIPHRNCVSMHIPHRITSHTEARLSVSIRTPHTETSQAIFGLGCATCRYLMFVNRNKSHVKFICRVTYFC